MKKLILCGLLVIGAAINAGAQPMVAAPMKEVVISTLMDYGVRMYDRHDFTQAQGVFNRILFYDPTHQGAQHYLAKINPNAIRRTLKPVHTINIPNNVPATSSVREDESIQELKQRIARKTQEINSLKIDLQTLPSHADIQESEMPAVESTAEFNTYLDTLRRELAELRKDVNNKRQQVDTIDKQLN